MDRFIGFNTDDGIVYINIRHIVALGESVEIDGQVWFRMVNGGLIYVTNSIEEVIDAINGR